VYRVPDSPKTSFHLAPHDTQPVANRLDLREKSIGEPGDLVDIICAGSVCDPSSSLATVKEFLWKKGSDVELVYRFKDGVDYRGDGGDGVATA
jgi:WD repeat-containing protein 48